MLSWQLCALRELAPLAAKWRELQQKLSDHKTMGELAVGASATGDLTNNICYKQEDTHSVMCRGEGAASATIMVQRAVSTA